MRYKKLKPCVLFFIIIILFFICPIKVALSQNLTPLSPDPQITDFPYSSLLDFSFLLNAPAGKHGFLRVKDGHFYWENGKRARFWGVNVASLSLNIEKDQIDHITDVFAKAGINIVRLEAIDNKDCIILEGETSRNFDPNYLDKIDYWIFKLKEKGIYVYMDLLDFRTFKEGDGVPSANEIGRAAKPYAIFNPRLIELQKEYAQKLLTHKNPYTGLKFIDDPAICLIEIFNEHGLIIKANTWNTLKEPYKQELTQYWNEFLLKKYKNTENLKKAWKLLPKEESLENNNISLPPMNTIYENTDFSAPLSDGLEFAYEIQTKYFREMYNYLREIGVKIPITAAVSTEFACDVQSVASTLDFTTENFYWDHPSFEPGNDWKDPYYYNNKNELLDDSLISYMPYTSILKWENKPVVIREWAVPWPNSYRGASVLEVASYSCLQDFDAVLLFAYRANKDINKLREFSFQADSAVWGLYGIGAKIFLNHDIKKAEKTYKIEFSNYDLFFPCMSLNNIYKLSWISRIFNTNSTFKVDEFEKIKWGNQRKNSDFKEIIKDIPAKYFYKDKTYTSDTNEITRNFEKGIITVNSPNVIGMAGNLTGENEIYPLRFGTKNPFTTIIATSMDDKPLTKSEYFIIKMTTIAENKGQYFYKDPASPYPDKYKLENRGEPPATTLGKPSNYTVDITWKEKTILSMYLENGSFELIVNKDKWLLYCDTPDIMLKINPNFENFITYAYLYDNSKIKIDGNNFNYPKNCKYLEIKCF